MRAFDDYRRRALLITLVYVDFFICIFLSMLTTEIKENIQAAYRNFLKKKNYGARRDQRKMIADIAQVLANAKDMEEREDAAIAPVAVIEAATGIGKTIAYLMASIPIAQAKGKKIVVSTATIALQEQILFKDLPDIRENSGLQFEFALAKGRGRYACTAKLMALLENDAHPQNSLLFEQRFLLARNRSTGQLYQSLKQALFDAQWPGDRESWPDVITDSLWFPLTTTHHECAGRRCRYIETCPFFMARRALQDADCIIANHDLVLSDLALGGGVVLPPPTQTFYIFDEGHHLPEKTLEHFASHMRLNQTLQWLQAFIAEVPSCAKQLELNADIHQALESLVESSQHVRELFLSLLPVCQSIMVEQENLRFENGRIPEELKHLANTVIKPLNSLQTTLDTLLMQLKKKSEEKDNAGLSTVFDHWLFVFGFGLRRVQMLSELWSAYLQDDDANYAPHARWLVQGMYAGVHDYELHYSPILAASVLRQYLWKKCHAAVLTSATLSSGGNFHRLRMQSGLGDESYYARYESPFNYQESALLLVPSQATDPINEAEHLRGIVEYIHQNVQLNEGSLVLFNAQRQMEEVFDALSSVFQDITLMQGDLSKQQIIARHKNRIECGEGSMIFGLASFFEGVDLPGKYLEHVIIARIPFAVPSDPVAVTLNEWLEKQGKNPFDLVTVPDAIIRLLQACGRLLRSEHDRGKVAILDRRIVTKRYGKRILQSLPPFKLLVQAIK